MARYRIRHFGSRFLLGAGLLCAASMALAQTAEEIVAANIAASGGESAIARIASLTRSGQLTVESPFFGKLEGTLEGIQLPGRAYYESVELGVISQRKGWDGERAWEQGPSGLRMLEGPEAAALEMQSFIGPLVALRQLAPAGLKIERRDDMQLNGRSHYVLGVASEGAPASTLYVDRETGLLSRSETVTSIPGIGDATTTVDVGGYTAVSGVMLPTTLVIDVQGMSTTRATFERSIVNTAVDEAIFAVPEGAQADDTDAGAAAESGPPSANAASAPADPFGGPYRALCAICHGENLEGAAQGTPLVGNALEHGDSIDALASSIAAGFPSTGMPAWSETLDTDAIRRLAIFVAEQRAALTYTDFKVAVPVSMPAGAIAGEAHTFRVETVAEGIDALPYSIAPLPDGRILVTEKTRGLRIVSADGELSAPLRGTPEVFDDGFEVPGIQLVYGQGYLLDVAPHPDYAANGWLYLSHTDRCAACNAESRSTGRPVSMVRLIRGRIEGGAWVDEETIWRAAIERYTAMPDMAAGGRIAFDGEGHVFLTVGIKGGSEIDGVQDLAQPYGKVHRVNDDGGIPADNPFVDVPNALASIWTYGHRSPQGLELDRKTGRLWSTEMGQRGGDEVNLLRRGRNYGWPLHSKGVQYDGRPVDFAEQLGIELDLGDIEQPLADLTPSPAVSSFVVYDGGAFPGWQGNLLVGTLKATELYRLVVRGRRIVHRETLLEGLGRIRDVETGPGGFVYLLLEHASGSRIVRLAPAG